MKCKYIVKSENSAFTYKLAWDSSKKESFLNCVDSKKYVFDSITSQLLSGETTIDECMSELGNIIYDISASCFLKRCCPFKSNSFKKKCPWFDNDCKTAKKQFYAAKKTLYLNNCEDNKLLFLNARNHFQKIKRRAKAKYFSKEKSKLSELSKKSPRKFWKYINKFKKSVSTTGQFSEQEMLYHFVNISNTHEGNFTAH